MRRIVVFLVGLLMLGLLGYTCVYNKADSIQSQLSLQIQKQLSAEQFKYVALHMNGRNLLLKGEIASDELKREAEGLAKIEGVYLLDNQIKVMKSQR